MDITKYTIEQVIKHLILIEDHLVNWSEFCYDCTKFKHLLALEGYKEECAGVCEYPELWSTLNSLIKELKQIPPIKSESEALEWREKVRDVRKKFEKALKEIEEKKGHLGHLK